MPSEVPELTLYGRDYCHLCEDMRLALEPLRKRFGFGVRWADVDADPALEELYGERVPVLVAPDGAQLCHYLLDEGAVLRWAQTMLPTA